MNDAQQADAKLAELYARVPSMNCKGHCHTTCGPIEMSNREREKIRDKHGIEIPEPPPGMSIRDVDGSADCPALGMFKQCRVYEDRPMVCRIWGTVEHMPCIYGCEVNGEPLTYVEDITLNIEAYDAGGWPASMVDAKTSVENLVDHLATSPRLRAEFAESTARSIAGDRKRARDKGLGHLLT